MFTDLLNSSYFALFLIVALGFMLGRIKIKGLSLDVSAVIFIALLFGHFGVIIPKELGNFGLVLFIFTIGIQAGPGFFDSFRSKGKTLIIITLLIICSAALTATGLKYAFDIDTRNIWVYAFWTEPSVHLIHRPWEMPSPSIQIPLTMLRWKTMRNF